MRTAAIFFLFVGITSIGCLATIPATCWDAASEFNDAVNSDAANPSGVWSYGWKESLTARFVLAKTPAGEPSRTSGWSNPMGYPRVIHNIRAIEVTVNVNPITLPPFALALNPGPNGEYAVVRFTAPVDGTFRISGQFYGLNDRATGTTTDVWILPNGSKAAAFSATIDYHGSGRWASFTSKTFELKKNDILDFEAGHDGDKQYEYDTTGLIALIEKVK